MSRFIESVRIQYRKLYNIAYHNARANAARREVLGIETPLDLSKVISIPLDLGLGLYKCRVLFGQDITSLQIDHYQRKRIRSLRLVHADEIAYDYKYADRSGILALFGERDRCDDILIVRNGLITDTSYANVAFYNGAEWLTPAQPLLRGTKRQELLDDGVIREKEIRPQDLRYYTHCVIFNALRSFDPRSAVPVDKIFP